MEKCNIRGCKKPARLQAEEGPLEPASLRRRESRLREDLHNLVCELPLVGREWRRVSVPGQTSPNVCVDPGALARQFVGDPVQLTHLVEERLELSVVDGHEP